MMKRLITLLIATFLVCTSTWANEEYNIVLEKGDATGQTIYSPYGNISFRLVEYGNYHRVLVTVENVTTSQAILLFKKSQDEKVLKDHKPKIEFEKTYPGGKGNRNVFGCKELNNQFVSIIPQDKLDLFGIDVSTTSINKLELPIYLAKYKHKDLNKKGAYNINYKILSEDIIDFNIEIKGWSENDPEYVSTKGSVEDYLQSIKSVTFYKNKKHIPLAQQMKPYQEKKDSLINVIKTVVDDNDWMSDTAPYQAYKALQDKLDQVNLNEHIYDPGEPTPIPKPHSCKYCSLSAQQIYHQLDDLYQQLRNGKIDKTAAVKKAKGLNTCYQKNAKHKKDSSYTDKIAKFYGRIMNY